MRIKYAKKLHRILSEPKRTKILVGGRGSTKSTAVADYALSHIAAGELWCMAREYQNTIEESVHRLLLDEVDRLGIPGFNDDKNHIYHASGGRNFYRGLARNISGIKSMLTGVDGMWIEEGESLSANTLKVLTASIRLSAADTERAIAGEDIKLPEIWITMNRGSSKDPISQRYLKRADKDLAMYGYYEDDGLMICQINYDEIPKKWFIASGLEIERADDEANMSTAEYDHKWHGEYSDSVENAIMLPEWFDACIDAHKKLDFKASGVEVMAHDPSDLGPDTKGNAYRHGSVITHVWEEYFGDINDGGDWAADIAESKKPDWFVWDCDGMGVGLRRQFMDRLGVKKIRLEQFKGSNTPDNPDRVYDDGRPSRGAKGPKKKTNRETFLNKRAQYYMELRNRVYRTYKAVKFKKYTEPSELISFDSSTIDEDTMKLLRAEMCRIPQKPNGVGKFQIMSKKEMRQLEIDSPNMSDAVMMCLFEPPLDDIDVPPQRSGRKRDRTIGY